MIEHRNGRYKATIFRVDSGKRRDAPDVIAEFMRQEDRWLFLNFYNPSKGTDLLSILKSPRPACSVPRTSPGK
jgi:hypothetical protein